MGVSGRAGIIVTGSPKAKDWQSQARERLAQTPTGASAADLCPAQKGHRLQAAISTERIGRRFLMGISVVNVLSRIQNPSYSLGQSPKGSSDVR